MLIAVIGGIREHPIDFDVLTSIIGRNLFIVE